MNTNEWQIAVKSIIISYIICGNLIKSGVSSCQSMPYCSTSFNHILSYLTLPCRKIHKNLNFLSLRREIDRLFVFLLIRTKMTRESFSSWDIHYTTLFWWYNVKCTEVRELTGTICLILN